MKNLIRKWALTISLSIATFVTVYTKSSAIPTVTVKDGDDCVSSLSGVTVQCGKKCPTRVKVKDTGPNDPDGNGEPWRFLTGADILATHVCRLHKPKAPAPTPTPPAGGRGGKKMAEDREEMSDEEIMKAIRGDATADMMLLPPPDAYCDCNYYDVDDKDLL